MATQTSEIRRFLIIQALLVATGSIAFLIFSSPFAALACAYGGAIAFINSWLLKRHVDNLTAAAATGAATAMLFAGLIERLIAAIVLFGIALAGLKLQILPLITGFAVAQLAYTLAFKNSGSKP
jgi:F0F1-type ATP synthase assembly protein I